jgi:PIN domain nuclease of toxin-antitoxin system
MNYVMDASAMVAFLYDEPGASVVEGILLDPSNTCVAHAVNLCEVFYDAHRRADETAAQSAIGQLLAAGIVAREDMDPAFWQEVGRLKAPVRVSLADAFGIALTRRLGGELVTGDHREFDPLVPLGLCPIRFFR